MNPIQTLTVKETSEFLDVTPACLAKWRRQGTGPRHVKVGRLVRYRATEIKKFGMNHSDVSESLPEPVPEITVKQKIERPILILDRTMAVTVLRGCEPVDCFPKCPGVYVFNLDDRVLYVGSSQNLRSRLGRHHHRAQLLRWPEIKCRIISCLNYREVEEWLIEELWPILNGKSPRLMPKIANPSGGMNGR